MSNYEGGEGSIQPTLLIRQWVSTVIVNRRYGSVTGDVDDRG